MPEKWQHLRPNTSKDTGASWGSRQKIRGGTQIVVPPDLSSDRAMIACTVEEKKKKLPFPGYIRKQKDSHQYHIGKAIKKYIYNRVCQWYEAMQMTLSANALSTFEITSRS